MAFQRKTAAVLAVIGVCALTVGNASAAAGFAYTGYANKYNSTFTELQLSAQVYEYRGNTAVPSSITGISAASPVCTGYTAATAPVLVVFGGNDGSGYDYTGFTEIAAQLDQKACTRTVYVRFANTNGYFSGTSGNPGSPGSTLTAATSNVEWAMGKILTFFYPSAKRVTYVGGSASAMIGAKLLETKFYDLTASPSASVPWSRVKRIILAGPPLGNAATACRYTKAGSLYDSVIWRYVGAGRNCSSYLTWLSTNGYPDASGNVYQMATQDAKNTAAAAGLRINMFIGTQDELFGWSNTEPSWATGPQGVQNFMNVSGVSASLSQAPGNSSAAGTYSGNAITYSTTAATHTTVWSRPDVVKAICYLAVRETSVIGSLSLNSYLQKCD